VSERISVQLDGSVTIVVTRVVKPGRDRDYEAWLRGVVAVSATFPGHLGATVIRPGQGSRSWTLIFRFATQEQLDAWDRSPERAEWVARGEEMCEHTHLQRMTGLEGWFVLANGGAVAPPPRWKMVLVTFSVAFPTIQLLNATLVRWLQPFPAIVRGIALGASMVLLMTYALMPLATRLLGRWLYPDRAA
jgi:antibiotic biosynthesis monooxygenase (ABM) superfamily enzyme